jgi:integrase
MSMLLHRLDATITVHGFRSSFRDWAAETGVEFSVAEQCLAHAIGGNVTRSYLRTSMLELRRSVGVICLRRDGDNVVELRRTGA